VRSLTLSLTALRPKDFPQVGDICETFAEHRSRMDVTESDFVWGATAIAKLLCLSERATFHRLEKGGIPGATKFGGRWCLIRPIFFAEMQKRAAAHFNEAAT
jgi:hypothetical protein